MRFRPFLAVLFFAVASWAAADVHFGLVETSDAHHYYRSSGLTSFEVRYEGEIELSPDRESVVALAPGSSLEIRRRSLFTTRILRVTPGENGRPSARLWISDRTGSAQDARDFLARNLPEVARVTAVGARAEARRLLALGPNRLLDAIAPLESSAAQEIYFDEFLKGRPLDPVVGKRAIEVAAREISSSTRLRRILSDLAVALPPDPALTGALARACSEISSSSQSADAITAVAQTRGVPSSAAPDYARSIREISSSSEKAGVIERVGRIAPDPSSIELLAETAESIASSSEMHRALASLAGHPGLAPRALARILSAGSKISSSSEKASLLRDCAPGAAGAPEARLAYLETAKTIDSSSELRRALEALLRPDLGTDGLAAVLKAARGIDSSTQKADLLVQAAGLSLQNPVMQSPAFSAYLECAARIDSSSEKSRALRALLARANLAPDQRKAVMDFAEREISSSSERETVLHAAVAR